MNLFGGEGSMQHLMYICPGAVFICIFNATRRSIIIVFNFLFSSQRSTEIRVFFKGDLRSGA